jgi:hypothetical protein
MAAPAAYKIVIEPISAADDEGFLATVTELPGACLTA